MADEDFEPHPTRVVFAWRTPEAPPSGGRGSSGGVGLAEWKGSVVWRGSCGTLEKRNIHEDQWTRLSEGDGISEATLVAHKNKLLAVGGVINGKYSASVRTLKEAKGKWVWSPGLHRQDMMVGCGQACVIDNSHFLLVIGGYGDKGPLNLVQVYSHSKRAWSMGVALPNHCTRSTAVLCKDSVILLGGMQRSVWHAKISELVTRGVQEGASIWKQLPDVPYCWSSACMVNGILLAIGGEENSPISKKTTAIFALSQSFQKWLHVGDIPFEGSLLDSQVCGEELVIVDGSSRCVAQAKMNGLKLETQLQFIQQQWLAEIENENKTLKSSVTSLQKDKQELEDLLKDKEEHILSLTSSLDQTKHELTNDMNSLKKQLEEALHDKEKEVSTLNEALANSSFDVNSLKKQLEEALHDKEKEVSTLNEARANSSCLMEVIGNENLKLIAQVKQLEDVQAQSSVTTPCHTGVKETNSDGNVSEIFRKHFATMCDIINPDDIIPELYARGLISKYERDEILATQKIMPLLCAVEKAIDVESSNFYVFLKILSTIPKYQKIYKDYVSQ